jgi:hypothetical protein
MVCASYGFWRRPTRSASRDLSAAARNEVFHFDAVMQFKIQASAERSFGHARMMKVSDLVLRKVMR